MKKLNLHALMNKTQRKELTELKAKAADCEVDENEAIIDKMYAIINEMTEKLDDDNSDLVFTATDINNDGDIGIVIDKAPFDYSQYASWCMNNKNGTGSYIYGLSLADIEIDDEYDPNSSIYDWINNELLEQL